MDLLWEYAGLQRFDVTPSMGAVPLTSHFLLDQFQFSEDQDLIVAAHPWLLCGLNKTSPD